MPKKYQVFVSSTFVDLEEARAEVFRTIYEMDCIVAGMELFPAIDEEQFQFIRRVIDDSDYYVILVGNRYGTLSPSGMSYTELEYDYAVSQGLKIVALLHEAPNSLPVEKSDVDPDRVAKLDAFRKKIRTGRLVRTWAKPEDLAGLLSVALQRTMTTYPARGWVRGDTIPVEDLLLQINSVRSERDDLQEKIAVLNQELSATRVQTKAFSGEVFRAALETPIAIQILPSTDQETIVTHEEKLRDVLAQTGLPLFGRLRQWEVKHAVESYIARKGEKESVAISEQSMDIVAYALTKVGLIDVTVEIEEREEFGFRVSLLNRDERRPMAKVKVPVPFWALTPIGRDILAAQHLPESFESLI